jgi:L-lactate dehydrogenase complex protein LldG
MPNNSREQILSGVRANIPRDRVEHPRIPVFGKAELDLKSTFEKHLQAAGGAAYDIENRAEAQAKVASLHPTAQVICSAVPEIPGTRRVETIRDPHELADVDVGVVRAQFGVAESGAVWLTQEDLIVNKSGLPVATSGCFARSGTNRS